MPVEVELVELVEPEPTPPTAGASAARPRRAGWWLALGAALLVGVLVVTQHVMDERRLAHEARFDHVPGVLRPLDAMPVVATGDVPEPWQLVPAGPVVIGSSGDTRTATVVGYDRATGQRVWSADVALLDGSGRPGQDLSLPADVRCEPLGTPGTKRWSDQVACTVGASGQVIPPEPERLVVLRTSDGSVVAERTLRAEAWTTLGDLVVEASARRDDDGAETWTVAATTATGEPAWEWTAAEPIARDGLTYTGSLTASSDGPLLSVQGHWWRLDDAGRLTQEGSGPGDYQRSPGRGNALLDLPLVEVDDGSFVPAGRVVLEHATGSVEFPGRELHLTVDDGSAPELMWFTTGPDDETLEARSTTTGEVVWSQDLTVSAGLALGGRLYVCADGSLDAIDADDGRTLWHVDRSTETAWCSLATDGRVVIAVEDGRALRAHDLEDGTERWAGTLDDSGAPAGLDITSTPPGVLVAVRSDEDGPHERGAFLVAPTGAAAAR